MASAASSGVTKTPRLLLRPSCFSCAWYGFVRFPNESEPRTTFQKPVAFSERRSVSPSAFAAACASSAVIACSNVTTARAAAAVARPSGFFGGSGVGAGAGSSTDPCAAKRATAGAACSGQMQMASRFTLPSIRTSAANSFASLLLPTTL